MIGRALVEAGLVKSANISAAMETLYVWEGALVENTEHQLIVKVPGDRREQAVALIQKMHSFEVPAIVGWPVAFATADYKKYNLGED